jgi:hypothetical protein
MQEDNWSDTDKAQWILENGKPDYVWIFERVNDIVYKRPAPAAGCSLPPWINREREIAYVSDGDTFINTVAEFNTYTQENRND